MFKDKKFFVYVFLVICIWVCFVVILWCDFVVSFGFIILLILVGVWLVIWLIWLVLLFFIIIVVGFKDSNFWCVVECYKMLLVCDGIWLDIVEIGGLLDNFKCLVDLDQNVDVGFVQGGLVGVVLVEFLSLLVLLGSIFYVLVLVYYCVLLLCEDGCLVLLLWQLLELVGKWIVIGGEGSGFSVLVVMLFKVNGVELGGSIQLLNIGGDEVVQVFISGKIDVVFLMGDLVLVVIMGKFLCVFGIWLLDFLQVDVYVWCFCYFNIFKMFMGVFDLVYNLLVCDIQLIVFMVELVVCEDLYLVFLDLFIVVVCEVYGKVNVMQKVGEFLVLLEYEYLISDDVVCYYKFGKIFFYCILFFWMVSLVDCVVVIVLLVILFLILGICLVLMFYGWCVCLCIYCWYGELIVLECGFLCELLEEQVEMFKCLDEIEIVVNCMKMLLVFVDQFYVLWEYIGFVWVWLVVGVV